MPCDFRPWSDVCVPAIVAPLWSGSISPDAGLTAVVYVKAGQALATAHTTPPRILTCGNAGVRVDRVTAAGAVGIFCAVFAAGLPLAWNLGERIAAPVVVVRPSVSPSPVVRWRYRPVPPPRQPAPQPPAVTWGPWRPAPEPPPRAPARTPRPSTTVAPTATAPVTPAPTPTGSAEEQPPSSSPRP